LAVAVVLAMATSVESATQQGAISAVGDAVEARAEIVRVRSDDPEIVALLAEASSRSATFSGLVEGINNSDGIVWIQTGKCGFGVRACMKLSVTQSGPNRLLRIVIDTRKADWDLMGSLGHELQHALEVLSDPTVTSDAAVYLLYRRIGEPSGDRFETETAIRTGDRIRDEALRAAASRQSPTQRRSAPTNGTP
jgi:hypothetical protein